MDFRKAFFPTADEVKTCEKKLQEIRDEQHVYFKRMGFTEDDCLVIETIEAEELLSTNRFQSHSSRYSLLQSGIITVDQVRADIEKR